jgi:hypothetical protein
MPLLALLAVGLSALVALAPPAFAGQTQFGDGSATAEYGVGIEFVQEASVTAQITRAELLLDFPGALGPQIVEQPPPNDVGSVELRGEILLAEGHILPNTTITSRWRITDADGDVQVSPPVTVRYEDSSFDWRTIEGDVVRVHWAEGGDAFGERALQIGERAVAETAELLGVSEDEPVDFFIYADQARFFEALGPSTGESVGGQANSEIRTLFALITPGEIDDPWVESVIPHELVHLVFDTAVDNPYSFPPRWLNEGLAVYLSDGYSVSWRLQVEDAAQNGRLIPLPAIAGQFPAPVEQFRLAYAESVSAVDYLIAEHGRDALIALIRSYANGVSDDEAFETAIGRDVAAFDAAWRESLDAVEPQVHGPQPAPPGPVPPGWLGPAGSPVPTLDPGAPGRTPGTATQRPGAPEPGGAGNDGSPLLAVLIGGLVVAGVIAIALANRRRSKPTPPPAPPTAPPTWPPAS